MNPVNDVASSSRPSPTKLLSTNWTICSSVMFEVLLPEDARIALNAETTVADEPFVGLSTNVFGSLYKFAIFTVCSI